ncbi:leucyl aminopeptidase, partial [Acinetobacter baumannii]
PGDIVTSMSGQTIEIINTDAEGRLVLADVLWYVAKKHKPKFMVDLATLTGAIMVALGIDYAGMFSNDDKLAERLTAAGQETGERVWR